LWGADIHTEYNPYEAGPGADFIQTQFCFDVPRFKQYMGRVRDLGLHERVYILVGVGPLRSGKAAEFMRTRVPGVCIPDEILERLAKTPRPRQREEGIRICIEIIQQVREIESIHGVHVMAYRQEETVAELIHRAGLLPRRPRQELPRRGPSEITPPAVPDLI
jgi:methylenetetrahydrofolate reductase (NADPH)